MPTLVALTVHDDPEAWRRAGFAVTGDGTCQVGAVRLHLVPAPGGGRPGLAGWTFTGLSGDGGDLDGIRTTTAGPGGEPPAGGAHPNGATSLDHVVVASPDLERTTTAFESAGLTALRVRDTEAGGRPMRQVFFRPGEAIIELVGPPAPDGTGPSRFFGLAFTVADLDAAAGLLGDAIGRPKGAVQPGRRIATLRGGAGLAVPVALMTPEPATPS